MQYYDLLFSSWFSFLAYVAFIPWDSFYFCMVCASTIHPLQFYVHNWSTSKMKVNLRISSASFFVSMYLMYLIYICEDSPKVIRRAAVFGFWTKYFLRNSSDKMWTMWYPGESIGWPDNAQCAICRLFVKVNWSCSIPEPPFWEFLPPSPELSCPIYVYTQQSLKKICHVDKEWWSLMVWR